MNLLFKDNYVVSEKQVFDGQVGVDGFIGCQCGCKSFKINYIGKKGIISSQIRAKNHHIIIKVVCSQCGKEITLCDNSNIVNDYVSSEMMQYKYKDKEDFSVNVYLSYLEEKDYLTDNYYTLGIKIIYDEKEIVIYDYMKS